MRTCGVEAEGPLEKRELGEDGEEDADAGERGDRLLWRGACTREQQAGCRQRRLRVV